MSKRNLRVIYCLFSQTTNVFTKSSWEIDMSMSDRYYACFQEKLLLCNIYHIPFSSYFSVRFAVHIFCIIIPSVFCIADIPNHCCKTLNVTIKISNLSGWEGIYEASETDFTVQGRYNILVQNAEYRYWKFPKRQKYEENSCNIYICRDQHP